MKKLVQLVVNIINHVLKPINTVLSLVESGILRSLKLIFGFLEPLTQLFYQLGNLVKKVAKLGLTLIIVVAPFLLITIIVGKHYQGSDRDKDRGAVSMSNASLGESYTTPVYVDQGWDEADSLWFYNTTQGSNLLPYDFFVELEQANSSKKFIDPEHIDELRYLPQKATKFNPDALPLGFVKDTYKDRDYVGLTCAACHTGQVNYQGNAVRIDGGAASADMDKFLVALQEALTETATDPNKKQRFIDRVLARDSLLRDARGGEGYQTAQQVEQDLAIWRERIEIYNTLNHSDVPYGYARLDAFGRIYNRVLEHVLEKRQLANQAAFVRDPETNQRILSNEQIELVLDFIEDDELVLTREEFERVVRRLISNEGGLPGLNREQMTLFVNTIFNPADAPVSYPFLWDIAQSDYVQWNGLAANAGIGPLGRNAGEVMGVFATLDWKQSKPRWYEFSLSAFISGQSVKKGSIDFESSVDKVNLTRLESHLKTLKSPRWEDVKFADGSTLPVVDKSLEKWQRGQQLYSQYCMSCHQLIDRDDWGRRVVATMMSTDKVGTDPKAAKNSINYVGNTGNFEYIYQETAAGPVMLKEQAPVVQILTAATRGVIATRDPDKWLGRRIVDWLYALVASFANNDIKASVKHGDYEPDTTANPYASLDAYKARSLNGIWATAPYFHNGSVPSLYDLLLPKKRPGDPEDGEYRPDQFAVGCRE
ncbi:MAG: cytochrome c, partial [Acidiferrobacterales bacterium]|nr:cytochrome c [Acidiferrobacterales bacterium]